jgi:elongator complex protein 1
VEFWSTGNYHWYRKSVLHFSDPIEFIWDPESALCLHILNHGGDYERLAFTWDHNVSSHTASQNLAWAAVIDGRALLLTSFKTANVPPPMSQFKLTFDTQVVSVAYSGHNNGNDLAVMTTVAVFLYTASTTLPIRVPQQSHVLKYVYRQAF